ncbi:DUF6221 family protein [Streptomyces niveus]|uniref:DUF6221 family protein n=1 Tax=Streptomyces niveus TaxID=193462 RepID=UPI00371FA0D6
MDDLVAFLRARLDEDEQAAHATEWCAATRGFSGWGAQRIGDDTWEVRSHGAVLAANLEQGDVEHIGRHDPARVPREILAHRTTVDQYDIALGAPAATDQAAYWRGHTETLRDVCLRIAAVHADQPDHMEAWRP